MGKKDKVFIVAITLILIFYITGLRLKVKDIERELQDNKELWAAQMALNQKEDKLSDQQVEFDKAVTNHISGFARGRSE